MSIATYFQSNPKVYGINGTDRIFYRVVLQDSIFQQFPYAECILSDRTGEVINAIGYTDQLDVDIGLEVLSDNVTFSKLLHPFYIREQQLLSPDIANFIAPNIKYLCTSKYKKDDSVKSKSYQGNLSEVISGGLSDFIFDSTRITATANIDYYYQPEISFFDFIQNNIDEAYSLTYPTSPYVSFINLAKQFHFAALKDLISVNLGVIPEFHLKVDDTKIFDEKLIRNLNGGYIGLDFTKSNLELFNIDDTMSIVKETKLASDMLPGAGLEKFLFRKSNTDKKRFIANYGLEQDSTDDKSNFKKGWLNSQYLNTYFPNRLNIMVQYPYLDQIVSGKNVKLSIDSLNQQKPVSKFFSGEWLILESKHIKDQKDNLFSYLLIGKNTSGIDDAHIFKADYL